MWKPVYYFITVLKSGICANITLLVQHPSICDCVLSITWQRLPVVVYQLNACMNTIIKNNCARTFRRPQQSILRARDCPVAVLSLVNFLHCIEHVQRDATGSLCSQRPTMFTIYRGRSVSRKAQIARTHALH